jgi:hypothetical protein
VEIAGTLELLAELAIAVLGFSGVVAVLGRRASGDWTDVDRLRFGAMVRIAALVLVLSLLPSPFRSAGLSESSLWAWCSGIGTALCVLLVVLNYEARKRVHLPFGWSDSTISKAALIYVLVAVIVAPLLLGLNAIGVAFERDPTAYLVALLLLFVASVVYFLRLLEASIAESRRAAQEPVEPRANQGSEG